MANDNDYNKAYTFLMKSSIASLERNVTEMSSLEQNEMTLALEAIMERAALYAGYIGCRGAGGGHAQGVKRANKFCSAARKTIGFNQYKTTISF